MDNSQKIKIGIITMIVLSLMVIITHCVSYKSGQIDALTGKVQFELVKHKDGSQTWERKLKKEEL